MLLMMSYVIKVSMNSSQDISKHQAEMRWWLGDFMDMIINTVSD